MLYLNDNASLSPPIVFGDNNNFKFETFKKELDDDKIQFEFLISTLNQPMQPNFLCITIILVVIIVALLIVLVVSFLK